jgi:hypothetical protein
MISGQSEASMSAFLIGTSVLAALALARFGYKASLRIAEWGRNMDEIDLIFQTAAGAENLGEFLSSPKQSRKIVVPAGPAGSHHLPI